MSRRVALRSIVLLGTLGAVAFGLASWKFASNRAAAAANAQHFEPSEAVTAAAAKKIDHRPTTTSIGTVLALRSITLRNELSGTVREVAMTPGQIVEEGALLVALDVSVEEAELKAAEAQAALAEAMFKRNQTLSNERAVPAMDLDRARAERDVAKAQIARIKAVIARKTISAPFRARVGVSDVHPGQYLNEGTQITTLQGLDEAVNVDFSVSQAVAAGLTEGAEVEVFAGDASARGASPKALKAKIVAIDARIDPVTRNSMVRAKVEGTPVLPTPGSSVRVRVPAGPSVAALSVPVSALRKGPGGDHVFVIAPGEDGKSRAHLRQVESGTMVGDQVVIFSGLTEGESVAASGSFKLRESALVNVVDEAVSEAK